MHALTKVVIQFIRTIKKSRHFSKYAVVFIGILFIILTSCTVDPQMMGFYFNDNEDTSLDKVTVEWDPNTEPDVVGYKVYYGKESGNYDTVIDVGDTTDCTITDLQAGKTYYITATAYSDNGLESSYADEIEYTASSDNSNS